MRARVDPRRVLHAVLAVVTVLGLAAAAPGAGSGRWLESGSAGTGGGATAASTVATVGQEAQSRVMDTFAFGASPGGELRVDVHDADVAIGPADGAGAEIEVHLRSSDLEWATPIYERMDFRARVDGSTVVIESDPEPRVERSRGRWLQVEVRVRVPERFDLDVTTDDGDIVVGRLEGRMTVRTGDGDVALDELRGPQIEVRTEDGDIDAERLAADGIRIDTSDGDVRLGAVEGSLDLRTSDGDIRIGRALGGEMTMQTGDGDVEVQLERAARIEIRAHDGDIAIFAPADLRADVELSGEDIHVGRDFRLDGRIYGRSVSGRLNGGGPLVRAETGDGTIRLIGGGS